MNFNLITRFINFVRSCLQFNYSFECNFVSRQRKKDLISFYYIFTIFTFFIGVRISFLVYMKFSLFDFFALYFMITLLFSVILCFQNVDAFFTNFDFKKELQLNKNLINSFLFAFGIMILYFYVRIQHDPMLYDPIYLRNNRMPSDFASSSKRTLEQADLDDSSQSTQVTDLTSTTKRSRLMLPSSSTIDHQLQSTYNVSPMIDNVHFMHIRAQNNFNRLNNSLNSEPTIIQMQTEGRYYDPHNTDRILNQLNNRFSALESSINELNCRQISKHFLQTSY